jgi:monovalent cation/hydrogen antiporter
VHFGTHDQLLLLALLAVLAALLIAAPKFRVPYPIFLVLGGLALGFVPGMPTITLPPEVVLVAVLPPLLYLSAYRTSLRDLRANAAAIFILAIGLVVATTVSVALVAHALVDDMSWSAAFALGAVVAPTDAIAATAIMRRLGVPRRLVSIIESESLVNDGTALVLFRVAVVAAVAGEFSLWDVSWRFVWAVVGGIGIGLVVGFFVAETRLRVDNPPVEVTLSLMTGYFAFIPASAAGASGVISVVTAGVYLGWRTPELTSVQTRLQGEALWSIVAFVLNALVFALLGLQLSSILDTLNGTSGWQLTWWALVVTGTVVLTRIVWVPIFSWRKKKKPFAHTLLRRSPFP